jgi:FlaA1/EpsC-like NDP-sugar epimerase
MKRLYLQAIPKRRMKGFYLDKNAPRWIILGIDLAAVLLALLLAYLLRFNFSIPEEEYRHFPVTFSLALFVKLVAFYIFKPYAGVIRHTGLNDFMRIFLAIAISSIAYAFINVIRFFTGGYFLIPYSVIVIDFLLAVFIMGSVRVTVKLVYHELQRTSKSKIRVAIYGAGQSGLTAKRALDRLIDSKYDVAAFFDDDKSKVGKRLEGTPILSGEELEEFLISDKPDQLIIAVQNIENEKKSEIVELALNYKVKPLNVPPVADWINGEINIKQIKDIRIEDLLGRKQIQLDLDKIRDQLNGKIVLVTGAAGSIGSGLVRQIAKFNPEKILMLDQAESPIYEIDLEIKEVYGNSIAEVVMGDIRDAHRMENVFRTFKPQVVYHAAAYKHVPLMEDNPAEAIRTNVNGTKTLVDLADKYKVERFVMVSTDKAVNPTNVMGASKRIAEIYAQSKSEVSDTQYITTRFGNVLGSNGSVIPLFRKQIEKGGPITVTHPDITRFFMTIPEACQLVLEAGMMGTGGEIFIFDMGKSVKIIDLAKKMIRLSGLELGRDIQIKFSGLRPGEKLYEELLANEENTLKTHHPQIMIAKVRAYSFDLMSSQINDLVSLHDSQDNMAIVKKMKELVPEYISKNSIYSKLDQA